MRRWFRIWISHQHHEQSAKELNKKHPLSLREVLHRYCLAILSFAPSARSHCSYLNGLPVAIAICGPVKGHGGRCWLGKLPLWRHVNKQKWWKKILFRDVQTAKPRKNLLLLWNIHCSLDDVNSTFHNLPILQDLISPLTREQTRDVSFIFHHCSNWLFVLHLIFLTFCQWWWQF